jgi:hypothetical protein
MNRWALVAFILMGISGNPAVAQPLEEEPRAFNPYSETALAITGPVILSTSRMVFETGGFLELETVNQAASGVWGVSGDVPVAQVFRVTGDVGPLRRDNNLCGDQSITYMAAWAEELSGSEYLGVAMFSGTEMPGGAIEEGTCGTYFYSIDVER